LHRFDLELDDLPAQSELSAFMRKLKLVMAITFCALCGLAPTMAADGTLWLSFDPLKAGEMAFHPVEGKDKEWQLVCQDVPAYDALVAIAKRKHYEMVFEEKAEAICRSVKLTGVMPPWSYIDDYILDFVSGDAHSPGASVPLPFGHFVEMKRLKGRKGTVKVIVVDKTGGRPATPPTIRGIIKE